MRYRYYFCQNYTLDVEEYLIKNNIKYKIDGERSRWIIFNIWSTSNNYESHLKELVRTPLDSPLVFAEYTASEYDNAQLLMIMPKRQVIDIENGEEAYERTCRWMSGKARRAMHAKQKSPFVIKKEPSMKSTTAFWCESTGFAEVFADHRVAALVKENSLVGVDFQKVILKRGGFSDKLFQMTSNNILTKEDAIQLGYGEKKVVCHICGKEQYSIDNVYQLHIDFSKIPMTSDLYMTERIFGEGIAYPLYLISQRFYKLLKENKIAGGVTFVPVLEVN